MSKKSFENPKLGEGYLLDLIAVFKEEAFWGINEHNEAQANPEKHNDTEFGKGYLRGYAHAYSRVISVMIKQARAYNIPLSELGLDDIDPDEDLLPGV